MFRTNHTREKLNAGQAVYGLVHTLGHPAVAEIMGIAGCDFVVVDGEHGLGDEAVQAECLRAVATTPATAILRVPSHEPVAIKRALDFGTEGLLVPDVRTAEQAVAIASACHYPPVGTRGFSAGTIRASGFGLQLDDYLDRHASELLVCVMIESAEGVENVADIASVDGVDVVQIGPFDLSHELGVPGQFEHAKFTDALRQIEDGVRAAGKILGGVPLPGLDPEALIERGYRMITQGADAPLLAGALRSALPPTPGSGD